jgi:hypothetical protein
MAKTRSFSIYLLKEGYDAANTLRDDHALEDGVDAIHLPEDARLFVFDGEPRGRGGGLISAYKST